MASFETTMSTHYLVVLNIAFTNQNEAVDNWIKTISMQRVPCAGEVIWVREDHAYTVTEVWWVAETGAATVRCVKSGRPKESWIQNLIESGFAKV